MLKISCIESFNLIVLYSLQIFFSYNNYERMPGAFIEFSLLPDIDGYNAVAVRSSFQLEIYPGG